MSLLSPAFAPVIRLNLSTDRLLRQFHFIELANSHDMLQTHPSDRSERETTMAGGSIPHFQNDAGHPAIEIGVKEFMCVGANPPFDHPHVFLDLGEDDEKVCPYCSTLYRYSPKLRADETVPAGCLYIDRAA
jgi:uncharacterized Zn-finger protein